MEIKAKSKFDRDSVRAFTHLSTYKKSNPKKTLIARTVLSLAVFLLFVVELTILGFDRIVIAFMFLDILIIAIDCFVYFVLPKIQYKSLSKLKEIENEYIFCDNVFKAFTKSGEYTGEAEIEYSLFVKAYETSKYFFLYQTNNQAYIVDKSTVIDGSAEEIRHKLSSYLGKKYIICKY